MKKKNASDPDNSMDFLLAEHNLAADERWKYNEHTWEVFKFYITLVTASGGFILALVTVKTDWGTLIYMIGISASIIFMVGLTIFMRLLRLDQQSESVTRRLKHVRNTITGTTSQEKYLRELRELDADFDPYFDNLKYTLPDQLRRATTNVGLKTQLVLINSLIGTLALSMVLVSSYSLKHHLLVITLAAYPVLMLLHAVVARVRKTDRAKHQAKK